MAFIGKNVIENLTTAMYDDPCIIYREYVQNAADSIDKAIASHLIKPSEASIFIKFSFHTKHISILDNGYGIPSSEFQTVMSSIADSEKDRAEEKGFRGIGRLGGISSCEYLRFSTSYPGEDVMSICTWNATKVREILVDKNYNPSASELVDEVLHFETSKCKVEEHFFKVELINVLKESEELLDEQEIIKYLTAVAPIPYDLGFIFSSKIYDFVSANQFRLDEYNVYVNEKQLFKPYTTSLYEGTNTSSKKCYDTVTDIKFEIIRNDNDQILAWMWYGICCFKKQIPSVNSMRGMRIRKGNIQIGNELTFYNHGLFKEARGSCYFIGEVFAVHKDLIPNARRDYFNLNSTCREFEKELKPILFDQFYNIYYTANSYKKSLQKQIQYVESKNEFDKKVADGSFIDHEDKKNQEIILTEMQKAADKAKETIVQRDKKVEEENNEILQRVFSELRNEYKIPETQGEIADKQPSINRRKKQQFITQSLSQYNKRERKLINKIYNIIKSVLPPDTANTLINKIQEELSK